MNSILKHPGAWLPIAMPLTMLAYILSIIAMNGVPAPDPNADEGAAAHLFQLWLVLEPLMIGAFVVKWLPRAPKQASWILVLQVVAALLPISVVFSLKL